MEEFFNEPGCITTMMLSLRRTLVLIYHYSAQSNRHCKNIKALCTKRKIHKLFLSVFALLLITTHAIAQNSCELQPFIFNTNRLIETLDYLGTPISSTDKKNIEEAVIKNDEVSSVEAIQNTLNKYALFNIDINAESRVKVMQGLAKPVLNQNGWTTFLIKINNEASISAMLQVLSEQAKRDYDGGEKFMVLEIKITVQQ